MCCMQVIYGEETYTTWTLPFEGEESVTSLLTSLGWDVSAAGREGHAKCMVRGAGCVQGRNGAHLGVSERSPGQTSDAGDIAKLEFELFESEMELEEDDDVAWRHIQEVSWGARVCCMS